MIQPFKIWAEVSAERLTVGGLILFLILGLLTLGDALLRRFLGQGIKGLADISEIIIILSMSACMPMVVWRKQALAIRVLGSLFPKRGEALLDLLGDTALLIFLFIVAWQMGIYVLELFQYGEIFTLANLPKYWVWGSAFFIWAWATVIQILIWLQQLGRLAK